MKSEKARWNAAAKEYSKKIEDKNSQGFLIREKSLNPYLFKAIGNPKGKRILDYGCGDGWLCPVLKDGGAEVMGVDISEEFIKIAKAKYPEIDFKVIDFDVPTPDNYFDMVIFNIVPHITKYYKEAMKEIHRVLKYQGGVVVTIMHPHVYKEEKLNPAIDEEVFDIMVEKTVPVKYYKRVPEIYEKSFKEAGFKIIDKQECIAKDFMPKGLEKYNKKPFFLLWKLEKEVKL